MGIKVFEKYIALLSMLEDITYEDGAVYSRETLVPTHKTTT
jgi:hypothetical protein